MATGLNLCCFPPAVVKSSTRVIHPKQIVEMTRIFRVKMYLEIARAGQSMQLPALVSITPVPGSVLKNTSSMVSVMESHSKAQIKSEKEKKDWPQSCH